jgi:hypothetical protein
VVGTERPRVSGIAGPAAARSLCPDKPPRFAGPSTPPRGPATGSTIEGRARSNTVSVLAPYQDVARDLAAALGHDSPRVWPIVRICGAEDVRDVLYLRGADAGLTSSHMLRHFPRKTSTSARRHLAGSVLPSRRTALAMQSSRNLRARPPRWRASAFESASRPFGLARSGETAMLPTVPRVIWR